MSTPQPVVIGNATRYLEDRCPNLPDPTPEHHADPRFDAIWNVIKGWDIDYGNGQCGGTGNHVRAILDALDD